MAELDRRQITYRYERWRALTSGILETASGTFLLLIAVRWFNANPILKALVASGGSVGLLLSPLVVFFVSKRRWLAAQGTAVSAHYQFVEIRVNFQPRKFSWLKS